MPTTAACVSPRSAIRMVIPYPPGGFTDVMARLLGEPLGKALGQSVIFENKPGANGMIGSEQVAKSLPDGYTLTTAMPSRSVILRAASSLRSFEPRYSNGRPCLRARATACALTRSPFDNRNGLTPALSISWAKSYCAIDQPDMIGR